ncbi:MAG: methylenetetrahydrofolate reductase [Negativicutes bacterium]|nr:methylenetetrahydrofolate reductase [Negativicutes bacterium]
MMSDSALPADREWRTESSLERLFAGDQFAVTAELGPPKGASAAGLAANTDKLKDYCDGLNITDNQSASVRLSSIAAAVHILRQGGNPIIQVTCRDRNRIAIQSDLLGAYSLGIRNVVCLSGDHQSFGNHPSAKNVFDIDSIQLIALVKKMREEKRLLCGEEMKEPPRFYIGAVESPFGDPLELRVLRLAKKVRAGAEFIQTQAVFDLEKFEQWMSLVRKEGLDKKVHILAGVLPIKSLRMVQYMKENVAGMIIPDELVERIAKAENPQAEGIRISVEIIGHLQKVTGLKGVHIMPVGWEAALPDIVTQAGLYPRPR